MISSAKKNRICILDGNLALGGGTQRIAAILANVLATETDWDVFLPSLNCTEQTAYFPVSDGVKLHWLQQEGLTKKILEMRRFLRKEKIDVIIDVDVMLAIYTVPATLLTKTKIISWEMFNIRNDIGSSHTDTVRKLLLKYGSCYVTQTKGDMEAFQAEMQVRCPIIYIHNPVEYDASYSGYDMESKTVITAGHFFYTKGYDLAIEVARDVFARHPDWSWHLYGDGRELEACQKKVKEYGLEKNVLFCGRTKEITSEYRKAAMYVMTSRTEGFGLVLTEAKAQNLPTLAFDCEFGPREIIEHEKSGYLVPAFDTAQMAERICELMEDPEKRKSFASHAKDNMPRFSLALFTEKWIQVINDVMRKKS